MTLFPEYNRVDIAIQRLQAFAPPEGYNGVRRANPGDIVEWRPVNSKTMGLFLTTDKESASPLFSISLRNDTVIRTTGIIAQVKKNGWILEIENES